MRSAPIGYLERDELKVNRRRAPALCLNLRIDGEACRDLEPRLSSLGGHSETP